ncbi:MAG: tetraacyldisaccharide 4'-kinase [Burkholderiaceae bacterium]|nr:tetraacyldisaccharide 4'-kinase [Burkholderiaceae bacterium]
MRAPLRMWRKRGTLARLLWPASVLYAAGRAMARATYRLGLKRPQRVGVPVVVVGNLYVGGTGKTPLVIELVSLLKKRGWHPGVVSRGYGGAARVPRLVTAGSRASDCGDEPLLIAAATGAPVAIGRDRVAAARLLRTMHPSCDVLIADDGLQHRRLARDFEVALIHGRGLGNGWLLPAGPLREPARRLEEVDAVVFNGPIQPVRIFSPFFFLRTEVTETYCLARPERRGSLQSLAQKQEKGGLRVLAACGIGTPESFFGMLHDRGLRFRTLALPDHYGYRRNPFPRHGVDMILITEKDAVKCRGDHALAHDERLWVVPLRASLDRALTDLIDTRLRNAGNGSKAA